MPRQRDPLSAEYDNFSERFLALAVDDPGGWHTATVTSPPGDPVDARGLSASERAVTRSLYYVLNSTAAEGPLGGRWLKNEDWSLQIGGWSAPRYGGGIFGRLLRTGRRRRVLTARIISGASAHAWVRDNEPAAGRYTEDPAANAMTLNLGA
jgi:hypothetical protein